MKMTMKCSACGNGILPDAKLCQVCGSGVVQPNTPESIREELTHHHYLVVAECVNCGYSGLMGSVSVKHPWYISGWVLLPLVATVVGIVLVVVLLVMAGALTIKYDSLCPVCHARMPEMPASSPCPTNLMQRA
jgi:predicted amidophosphoribosyltransferase